MKPAGEVNMALVLTPADDNSFIMSGDVKVACVHLYSWVLKEIRLYSLYGPEREWALAIIVLLHDINSWQTWIKLLSQLLNRTLEKHDHLIHLFSKSSADSNWKCTSSKCYYLAEDKTTWQEAKNLCTNLALVTTAAGEKDPSLLFNDNDSDFEKIESLFSLSTKVWINCSDKETENTFICDVDGTGSQQTDDQESKYRIQRVVQITL